MADKGIERDIQIDKQTDCDSRLSTFTETQNQLWNYNRRIVFRIKVPHFPLKREGSLREALGQRSGKGGGGGSLGAASKEPLP